MTPAGSHSSLAPGAPFSPPSSSRLGDKGQGGEDFGACSKGLQSLGPRLLPLLLGRGTMQGEKPLFPSPETQGLFL